MAIICCLLAALYNKKKTLLEVGDQFLVKLEKCQPEGLIARTLDNIGSVPLIHVT